MNAALPPNIRGRGAPAEQPHDPSGLLAIACLFTAAGGYMDAFSYIAHGHVFANAQTGNFVFFAVFASAGQWVQAWRHVPPIVAFSLGVAVAKLSGVQTQKRTFHATLLCQAFEVTILAILAVVGDRLPNASVVPIISFVAALQNTSFDTIGPWSFNSAMTTGNLRDAVSGLVLWITGREGRRKAITLSLICGSFLVGALCGGIYTNLHVQHALVPCVVIVATGFLLTWRLSRKASLEVGSTSTSARRLSS